MDIGDQQKMKTKRKVSVQISFETAVVCLLLVRLFMFQREKDEWRVDWSLLKYWLFRGFTPCRPITTRTKWPESFVVYCIQEAVYSGVYKGAIYCIRRGGGSISGSSMFCCFTQWTTSQGLSWHMSLCLHSIYHREAPAPSTFSTMKIVWLFTIITSLQSLQSLSIIVYTRTPM